MQTLQGTLLQPTSCDTCTITEQSVVRIDGVGKIAEVGTGTSRAKDVLGGPDAWIVPGFVDAHLHLPQWDRRGLDGLDLLAWREQVVYPAEARLQDPAVAEKLAEDFVSGVVRHGTTTVAAFGSPFAAATERVFSVFARRGLRAIYGKVLADTNCPAPFCDEADKALDESRQLAATWHQAEDDRLRYAFAPQRPMCCSEKLMRGTAALADMLGCYVQTHLAESLAEMSAVRDAYPDQMDDLEVFAEMGLLTERTLMGHGVFLNHQQRQQMAEAGTAVIHCPTANLFMECGLMDYVACRAAGVRLALGSSIAGGPDPFMPRVAVSCLQTAKTLKVHAIPRGTQPAPKPAEAWWLLTRGAAEALGWSDRIGLIEPGYDADVLVLRPEPWIAELPAEQRASALLYTLSPEQIEHVFIAGKRVGP